MKKTTKVFIILGMVFGFYLIYPIVVGVFAIKALNESNSKDELTTIGILTLIFCNLIAGILMLVMKDQDLVDNKLSLDNSKEKYSNSAYDNLIKLKKLFDEKIITEEEYILKKQKYLSEF